MFCRRALGLVYFTRHITKKSQIIKPKVTGSSSGCDLTLKAKHFSQMVTTKYDILKERDSWVVLSDDGCTILCWHPEVPFPYEHSKPLPEFKPFLQEDDSALKIQYRLNEINRGSTEGPSDEELQKITYTTKHIWYKRPGKKYRKPNPPRDREGI